MQKWRSIICHSAFTISHDENEWGSILYRNWCARWIFVVVTSWSHLSSPLSFIFFFLFYLLLCALQHFIYRHIIIFTTSFRPSIKIQCGMFTYSFVFTTILPLWIGCHAYCLFCRFDLFGLLDFYFIWTPDYILFPLFIDENQFRLIYNTHRGCYSLYNPSWAHEHMSTWASNIRALSTNNTQSKTN